MKGKKKRNGQLDSIKFCLIVLVIAGHVFSKIETSWPSGYGRVTWQWIYMFHMPLFVALSGYFSHKKSIKNFFLSSLRLLEPLVLFQVICIILNRAFTISEIFTPWWILWYLLSLFFWRTILQFLPQKLIDKKWIVIACAFILSILVGFSPLTKFLSLQRTFAFLPFFFIGYYLRETNAFEFLMRKKSHLSIYLSITFLASTILIPAVIPNLLGNLNQSLPYDSFYGMFKRVFVFLLSIPMSISFIILCPNNKYIAKQGRYTMQYYILHAFLVMGLVRVLHSFDLSFATSFWAAVFYTFTIVAIIWALSYLPFFSKVTNPSLFLMKQ